MFVGESGVGRVIQRTCDAMNQLKTDDAAKIRVQGVIDLPTIQRYLNFHFSVTSDLYGNEISSNAADYFASGLKGRAHEADKFADHVALEGTYEIELIDGDALRLAGQLNLLNDPRFLHERDVLMFTKNTPKLDATRRAIVRAAAAMGDAA